VLAAKALSDEADIRLTDFTHLVASSISNVHSHNLLNASRIRSVSAGDGTAQAD
jgi:hypothetical protein